MIGQICMNSFAFLQMRYAVASGDARVLERLSDYESRKAVSVSPGDTWITRCGDVCQAGEARALAAAARRLAA